MDDYLKPPPTPARQVMRGCAITTASCVGLFFLFIFGIMIWSFTPAGQEFGERNRQEREAAAADEKRAAADAQRSQPDDTPPPSATPPSEPAAPAPEPEPANPTPTEPATTTIEAPRPPDTTIPEPPPPPTAIGVFDELGNAGITWSEPPRDTSGAPDLPGITLLGDEGVISSAGTWTPNELDVYVRVYTDPAKRGEQTAILRYLRAQIPVAAAYVECGPIAIEIAYVGPVSPDRTAAVQQLAQQATAAVTAKFGPC